MKQTGVTRKLDELGRIVIPKEIRTNFKIEEGDQVEFYLNENEIIIKKPSPLNGLDDEIYKLFQVYNLKFHNSARLRLTFARRFFLLQEKTAGICLLISEWLKRPLRFITVLTYQKIKLN